MKIVIDKPFKDGYVYKDAEKIIFGNIEFLGYEEIKMKRVKREDSSDGQGDYTYIVDEDTPVQYDNLTTLIMDTQNSKQANADLLSQLAQTKLTNAQLLTEIAKLKGSTK